MTHHPDPLTELEDTRERLEAKLAKTSKEGREQTGSLFFWGTVGGVCIVLDSTILGGAATGLAGYRALRATQEGLRARSVRKELKSVEKSLLELRQIQARAQIEHAAKLDAQNIRDSFSPAAAHKVEALLERLQTLEKQLDQERRGKTLDKPKFDPPPPRR